MQGILITGGEKPEYSKISHLINENSYVVAADSGLDYCLEFSINPDFILGDMDSLSSKEHLKPFNSKMIEEHPEEKDYTDTELALIHLQKKELSPVIIIGGGGGRLDHLLAIYSLFDRPNPPDMWITNKEEVCLIKDEYTGSGKIEEIISFFPVSCEQCRMKSNGLKWPLDSLTWKKGDSGISNRLAQTEILSQNGNRSTDNDQGDTGITPESLKREGSILSFSRS